MFIPTSLALPLYQGFPGEIRKKSTQANCIIACVPMCVRTPVIIQFGVSNLHAGGCKAGSDYVNRMCPSFFAEYIQLDVVSKIQP